ncbi:GAP family protein [Mycobacterium sp. WMMD1722]|uniref:GAP family protein n=1 Tax=Mycobacterium sp. WMMD1722 TaxID=3404117 RepID=UPI003BF5C3DB
MVDRWGSVLLELIPLALVIALSPLSIIPAVLVLRSPRPRPAGLAFLAGWLLGLFTLAAVFLLLAGLVGNFNKPPPWAAWVRIVVGVVLIGFAGFRWLRRSQGHTPKWMTRLTGLSPGRSFITATVLVVVNPKVFFVCAAAGLAIGTSGLGVAGAWSAVVYFVLVAGSTALVPLVGYALFTHRLDAPLRRLGDWMEEQHATLVAGILLVIGLLVLYKGVHGVLG